MDDALKDKIEKLVDHIMKKCLWQFHSRTWDREKQNEGILTKTSQILCDEPVAKETPADRCYWVDAASLAEAYRARFPWLSTMTKTELKELMQGVKDRLDFLTIKGSLNLELTDKHY